MKTNSTALNAMLAGFIALAAFVWPAVILAQHAGMHDAEQQMHGMVEGQAGDGMEQVAGHSHDMAMRHGGAVAMTKAHHFESVWSKDGLRLYLYTDAQAPLAVGKAAGTVTFLLKNGASQEVVFAKEAPGAQETPIVYFCPMHPEVVQMAPGVCPKCGGMKLFVQDRLVAKRNLAEAVPGALKAVVKIAGLAGDEKEVTFTETFTGLNAAAARSEQGIKEQSPAHEHSDH
jgi:hypothetical protein